MIEGSEPNEIGNSEGLKSDKLVRGERPCRSVSRSFPSNASTLGVRGPADDCESGDPGVSSIGSTVGEIDNEVSIVKV